MMKHIIFVFSFQAIVLGMIGQSDELIPQPQPVTISDDEKHEAVRYAEIFPEYPGGQKQMYKDIYLCLVYPEAEKVSGITGKVFVDFVVEKNGEVSEVRVVREVSGHPDFSAAAIEAVRKLKIFKPAYTDNKEVRLRMTIPVEFSEKQK